MKTSEERCMWTRIVSDLSWSDTIYTEVNRRILEASSAFSMLQANVWKRRRIIPKDQSLPSSGIIIQYANKA